MSSRIPLHSLYQHTIMHTNTSRKCASPGIDPKAEYSIFQYEDCLGSSEEYGTMDEALPYKIFPHR